jgi:transposase
MTWSYSRVKQFVEHVEAGKSDTEIAKLLGNTRKSIYLRRLALKDDPTGMSKVFWTEQKIQRLKNLFRRGLSYQDIAGKLSTTVKVVRREVKTLNLEREARRSKYSVGVGRRRSILAARREKLVKMHYTKGHSSRESAELLGISTSMVNNIRKKFGLNCKLQGKEHLTLQR